MNMLNTIFDLAMLFGIASSIFLLIGGLIKCFKYLCEKVFKFNIITWLTSDDEN